jgi:hypothetical protein
MRQNPEKTRQEHVSMGEEDENMQKNMKTLSQEKRT